MLIWDATKSTNFPSMFDLDEIERILTLNRRILRFYICILLNRFNKFSLMLMWFQVFFEVIFRPRCINLLIDLFPFKCCL